MPVLSVQSQFDSIADDLHLGSYRSVAVAVSGGSDSMSLLSLAQDWAHRAQVLLRAVTVDHALRAESATEAHSVAQFCYGQGIDHTILVWAYGQSGAKSVKRLHVQRTARYRLIAHWAQQQSLDCVLLGHTRDDQAETFLLRLARGSGVDGLAAMYPMHNRFGCVWVRPLLSLTRIELRAFARAKGIVWIDDPSNVDSAYDRIKIRQAKPCFAKLGLSDYRLARTAHRMQSARQALAHSTYQAACQAVHITRTGDVVLDQSFLLHSVAQDIHYRLLAFALCWVASNPYRPRLRGLSRLLDCSVLQGTLHGCLFFRNAAHSHICIVREYAAVQATVCAIDGIWDKRWLVQGAGGNDLVVRALGFDGLRQMPHWRNVMSDDFPARALRYRLAATPAVWQGKQVLASLLIPPIYKWQARLLKTSHDFYMGLKHPSASDFESAT